MGAEEQSGSSDSVGLTAMSLPLTIIPDHQKDASSEIADDALTIKRTAAIIFSIYIPVLALLFRDEPALLFNALSQDGTVVGLSLLSLTLGVSAFVYSFARENTNNAISTTDYLDLSQQTESSAQLQGVDPTHMSLYWKESTSLNARIKALRRALQACSYFVFISVPACGLGILNTSLSVPSWLVYLVIFGPLVFVGLVTIYAKATTDPVKYWVGEINKK
ncbi:hypothetical protein [Halogranum rubrum]|uniref:hypothetical protein n=1 Tax=Halogranum rubrum TaxID=553466 RepID=UPI00067811F3|nr:hypothetical protein [Halogranum salarium]